MMSFISFDFSVGSQASGEAPETFKNGVVLAGFSRSLSQIKLRTWPIHELTAWPGLIERPLKST